MSEFNRSDRLALTLGDLPRLININHYNDVHYTYYEQFKLYLG